MCYVRNLNVEMECMNVREELEIKLANAFPFMKRNKTDDSNIYQRWGCECADGWHQLLCDLCQEITDTYSSAGIPIDIVVEQVKEKFASLRFYYSFEDLPCPIQAFDCLSDGSSIRFQHQNKSDTDDKKNLRQDIAQIVRKYENKSKFVCEYCGNEGTVRMELPWKRTLCDQCYGEYLKKIEDRKREQKQQIQKLEHQEGTL